MNQGVETALKLSPSSYWSLSASNLLSSIVLGLGADMRHLSDVITVLRTTSNGPKDEILRLIGEPERNQYRALCTEAFENLRSRAVAIAKVYLDAARNNGRRSRTIDTRRLPDRRVQHLPVEPALERRHIVDRRMK